MCDGLGYLVASLHLKIVPRHAVFKSWIRILGSLTIIRILSTDLVLLNIGWQGRQDGLRALYDRAAHQPLTQMEQAEQEQEAGLQGTPHLFLN